MKQGLTIALSIICLNAFAQEPAERWEVNENIIGYSGAPSIFSVEMDDNGNTYVGGYIANASDLDIFVAKYDADGNLEFYDTYDSGSGDDEGIEVGYDQSGNTYIVGNSRNGNSLFVRKYNTAGTVQWTEDYYGAIVFTHANDMEVRVSTGDVFIVGRLTNAISGEGMNIGIFRYDTNGNLVWEESFDGGSNLADEGHRLVLDGSGNVYVLGEANAGTPTLQKYTYAGAFSWGGSPQVTGENGSNGATLAIEGSNVAVYSWTEKKRYSTTSGVNNQNVTFQNTVTLVSGRPYYWRLSNGYIRAVSQSTIKRYNNAGTQTATSSAGFSNRFIMDGDSKLYMLRSVSTVPDSSEVVRYEITGSSISQEWAYRFGPSALNTFAISSNNTFSVGFGESPDLIVHNGCIPPRVTLIQDSDFGGAAVCNGDTMFLTADAEFASSYSWFGNGFHTNSDTIWEGLNFGSNYLVDLSMSVDGGNGCIVSQNIAQFTNYVGVDAYIVDQEGNCESDPGYLYSLIDPNYYEYNWYFDGVQQTFNSANDSISAALGNGVYTMEVLDTQTGCYSMPSPSYTVTGIMPDQTATLSYPSSMYTQFDADPSPTQGGTLGGTYSEATGYVNIDPNTGVIDLSESFTGGPYTIVYTTPGPCPGEASFDLTITPLVGMSDLGSEFSIAPNPVQNVLSINGDFDIISIHSVDGRFIRSTTSRIIVVSDLDPAIYLLRFTKDEQSDWIRFVKQ